MSSINSKASNVSINIEELQSVMKHLIETNEVNQSLGLPPVSANIVGHAGLGKTSAIEQMAEIMGYEPENVVILNLAQLNEIGDLIGIPVEEYRMIAQKEGGKVDSIWVREKAIPSYEKLGYMCTNDSRMTYSEPAWIKGLSGKGILILDDYTRASTQFTQAVMELISKQRYLNWTLPKGWTILLSSNPDDGVYTVSYQDPAQQSRYINLDVKFDAEVWAKWAEKMNIDSRCINFVLLNPEMFTDTNREVNPRSVTNFFNSIRTIPEFEKNLGLIQMLGQGSLGFEAAAMFTAFIHNKMDRIIDPKKIFDTAIPFKDIEKEIRDLLGSGTSYRSDIANMLTQRIINYLEFKLEAVDITDVLKKRAEELFSSDCMGNDIRFVASKRIITGKNGNSWNSILMNDAVYDMVID